MLIRTTLGRFWQTISEDGGRYWRIIQPGPLVASSAPGYLLRLHGGLLFVWNQMTPEGGTWAHPAVPVGGNPLLLVS